MGTRKSTSARILTLGCAGLFCLGASYTWTGNGADDDWDNGDNWSCIGACGSYPDTASDDATVNGTHDVDLIDECIDDLTITGTVNIGAAEFTPTLHVDTFTIAGPATVTIGELATIWTAACP